MAFRRPCLTEGCRSLSPPGRSRCVDHERGQAARKNARRRALETGARTAVRRALNRAGAGVCSSCRTALPASLLEVDHVLPLVDGGRDVETNLQLLCHRCHRTKTGREATERAARRR